MNAELIGIITVGIVLLGVIAVFIAQSEEIQLTLQIGEPSTIDQYTSSTRTDIQYYCDVIPALCR